jgi:hypothetical protein
MYDPISGYNYFDLFKKITDFLGCNLKTRKQLSTGNEYYTITASSRNSLSIILNYCEDFPLYSSKYLDYKD